MEAHNEGLNNLYVNFTDSGHQMTVAWKYCLHYLILTCNLALAGGQLLKDCNMAAPNRSEILLMGCNFILLGTDNSLNKLLAQQYFLSVN